MDWTKVRFLAPVKAGHACARTSNWATSKTWVANLVKLINTIEIEGEAQPALIAETLIVLVGSV